MFDNSNDLSRRISEDLQRAQDQARTDFRNMETNRINRQHHNEMLAAQQQISETNLRVAHEIHGIQNALQTQIDDNRKDIDASKIAEKKLSKRSWWQFGLSLFVSAVGVATSIAALIISLR